MKKLLSLHVNGKPRNVEVDPGTPLLYVLRNDLELNGPKYGCGLEECGSCMVLLDGKASYSCMVPVAGIQDRKIVTIEGLTGEKGELHPVQEAFYEEQAAQCGFCLNGMVITGVELLNKNPEPDPAAVNKGMNKVLCRCGTHSRIRTAITSAAAKNKSL